LIEEAQRTGRFWPYLNSRFSIRVLSDHRLLIQAEAHESQDVLERAYEHLERLSKRATSSAWRAYSRRNEGERAVHASDDLAEAQAAVQLALHVIDTTLHRNAQV
jgi:hypothetical protein